MSRTIQIVNEYPGILDLSVIKDVANIPVVLKPKGTNGASRECFSDASEHPSVLAMKKAGRISIKDSAIAPTPAPEPVVVAAPPAPAPATEPVVVAPEPVVAAPEPPPEPAPEPVAAAPEPEPEPEPAAAAPEEPATESEAPSASSFESRRGGKHKRG